MSSPHTLCRIGFRAAAAHTFESIPFQSGKPRLDPVHIQFFHENGFLVFRRFLQPQIVSDLKSRYQPLFDGQFDTGVYPDEWYGGRGMTVDGMTKEICGAFKSDLTIARVSLSSQLHSIASQLNGWRGSRIAQDSLLWKPSCNGSSVGFHTDAEYISNNFSPIHNNSITCWLPLDDVSEERGTVEYVKGSHLWNRGEIKEIDTTHSGGFHGGNEGGDQQYDEHRVKFMEMVQSMQLRDCEMMDDLHFMFVDIPAGGVSFHHQHTWHGSGLNRNGEHDRRALAVHTLNSECRFRSDREIKYIYGRYQDRTGDAMKRSELNESFFPICWHEEGFRSKWLEGYCNDDDIVRVKNGI